jgi:transposase-like protein
MLEFKYSNSYIIEHFINTRFETERACPHCRHTYTILYGKYNGRQRYMCKSCGRTFSGFTNTPLAMTHFPEKWETFMECTLRGMSLRAAAMELKVSYVTLFYWRHKLLVALKEIAPNKMNGTVELLNFYLKYSEKGKKHPHNKKKRVHDRSMNYLNIESDKISMLAAADFFGNIFSGAICRGRINTRDIANSIGRLLDENNIVCSKPKSMFSVFLRRMHIKEYEKALDNTSAVIKYMKDCMAWMRHFKGVATKYLNNYLSLYKFLKSIGFNETVSGVKSMIASISAINIRNTYMSITVDKLYGNS